MLSAHQVFLRIAAKRKSRRIAPATGPIQSGMFVSVNNRSLITKRRHDEFVLVINVTEPRQAATYIGNSSGSMPAQYAVALRKA